MKTFEELWAELTREGRARAPRGPAPSRSSTPACTSIGKKLVEEAAESWMAAEHEGKERAAEEISQLLYHAQVLMIASGTRPRRRLLPPLRTTMAPTTPDGSERLLRIAVPNKGALSQSASEILRESGYRQRQDSKELTLIDAENGVEFFYLRPRDIALYVGEGTLDTGITGRDLLRDSGAQADEALTLGFGRSRFHFAGPAGALHRPRRAAGPAHRHVVRRRGRGFLAERGIDATVTRLDGAVETSIQLGVADVIADVVETGSTLRQAGLAVFGEVDPRLRGGRW